MADECFESALDFGVFADFTAEDATFFKIFLPSFFTILFSVNADLPAIGLTCAFFTGFTAGFVRVFPFAEFADPVFLAEVLPDCKTLLFTADFF